MGDGVPPFVALDHVQLAMPAGREDEARRFYVGLLGMVELAKPERLAARGGVWFASGDVQLHLGVDAAFVAAKKAHPALRCTDYASLLRRMAAAGMTIVRDEALPDGSEHAYVEDPFGNRLELIAAL